MTGVRQRSTGTYVRSGVFAEHGTRHPARRAPVARGSRRSNTSGGIQAPATSTHSASADGPRRRRARAHLLGSRHVTSYAGRTRQGCGRPVTESWIGRNRPPAVGLLWALHCGQTALAGIDRTSIRPKGDGREHPAGARRCARSRARRRWPDAAEIRATERDGPRPRGPGATRRGQVERKHRVTNAIRATS